jgi:hypothetical protein
MTFYEPSLLPMLNLVAAAARSCDFTLQHVQMTRKEAK